MKYAIVNKKRAESYGIRIHLHRLNPSKTKMIVNENELRHLGDPDVWAVNLGGKLVSRAELNNLINSEVWQNK
jgi:hypothetical protein